MTSTISAALDYLRRGWSVFPLKGKHPRIEWSEYQSVKPTAELVSEWWTRWPDAGIGVALGKVSGVVRVDADGEEAVKVYESLAGAVETLAFISPSGGRGYLFAYTHGFSTDYLWKGTGEHQELKYMSDGRYTVLPPSPGYSWTHEVPVARLPNAILDVLLSRRAERELRKLEQELAPTIADPGVDCIREALKALHPARCDDRDSWLQIGMALHSAGEYLQDWIDWSKGSDKFKEGECERLWASFLRTGKITVRTLVFLAKQDGWTGRNVYEPLTDVGNGNILAKACIGKALYCRETGSWHWWDGKRWKSDGYPEVVEEQKRLVRDRYNSTVAVLTKLDGLEPEKAAKKLKNVSRVLKWCACSEDAKRIHAAVDMASSMPGIITQQDRFDKHPWLLNCENGVLDLRVHELRPHDPSLMLTKLCNTEYRTEAIAPRWTSFLSEVFQAKPDMIEWMQKFFGYCTTGHIREHVLPIFYGAGRNGKSTLIKVIIAVLGTDYASTAPQDFLAVSRNEQHPTRIAELHGKRFVADIETGDSTRLNEAMVKRLTGGDELVARRMKEDFWRFEPSHKLVLATNHRPDVRNTDAAIWSRLRLVPFDESFLGREEVDLDAKLKAEASGILRWMVEGCTKWIASGLGEAEQVAHATQAYRTEQDRIQEFLSAATVADVDSKLKTEDLMRSYTIWCMGQNVRPLDGRAFGRAITEKGYALDGTRKFRLGLKLA